ncbi:MAG: hypothetical protein M1818_005291 [Claussenomyces sp. TS43310]|nr:MAG: hypothetical protein M1818_005291 [Claussenomyces sp. TS43310]
MPDQRHSLSHRPTRSRSPRQRSSRHEHRTRSPSHHDHHHHRRHSHRHQQHRREEATAAPALLPYNARQLTKRDYAVFEPLFASYLDIQKGRFLEDLDAVEVKGRWKRFLGRWNRGELAEGWYDPTTLQKAIVAASEYEDMSRAANREDEESRDEDRRKIGNQDHMGEGSESDSDDSIGPELPGQGHRSGPAQQKGPSIPNMQDLELKRELEMEDGQDRREDLRDARRADRKQQRAALDELVPRAAAGTRERQLERKAEVNATMRAFRDRSPGAAAVPDAELLGGAEDGGLGELRRQKLEGERRKNERELRKEEMLRARAAEREERLAEYRVKEEGTMSMLKALAKQRFG